MVLGPAIGTCNDYAVTKRHLLLELGWPSRALLLAEVQAASSDDHHMVLILRAQEGDFVLDNLHENVRPIMKTSYQTRRIYRIQSPNNPKDWFEVAR